MPFMNEIVIIYTDGASSGNPGPGGWAAVVKKEDKVSEIGGAEIQTTNNRMEMSAAIGGLSVTAAGDEVNLYTDSQYLINGITKWVYGWMKNDWKTKEKKEVLNKDLWQELHELNKDRKVNWIAVKGHAEVALNNRVDEIAVAFSKSIIEEKIDESKKPELYVGSAEDYFFEVAPPTEVEMTSEKKNSKKNTKAYSYLSMIDGIIQKHSSWDDCKARVSGVAGAKFRKSISAEDEAKIIADWQNN